MKFEDSNANLRPVLTNETTNTRSCARHCIYDISVHCHDCNFLCYLSLSSLNSPAFPVTWINKSLACWIRNSIEKDKQVAMHFAMQTVGNTICRIRLHLVKSVTEFIASLRLSGKTQWVFAWERLKVLDYSPVLDLVCEHQPRFNSSWLETGEGEMLL